MRRIDAALARIEAASRRPRQDDSAQVAHLRSALAGAMAQIDGLIAELERASS